ncbi:MAG TPA: alkaline phosphatase family protein [Streptosporangiaceae bacterium]|nr:alkaline phosphatase family protein [Streptosporangiaceae bacterium]
MRRHSGIHGCPRTARRRIVALVATAGLAGLASACATAAAPHAVHHSASAQPVHVSAPRTPVRHIVLLYLENHSFDDLLGYWCDQHRGRCPDGGMPASVRLSDGTVVTPGVSPDIVPPVSHSVASQRLAIDGGKMDGWQKIKGCTASKKYACISGYKPSHVPNLVSLANRFAISDRTFSMADSPSWGGHLYAVMGSLDGFEGNNPVVTPGVKPGPGWGCDSRRITPWTSPGGTVRRVPSCVPDFSLGLRDGGAFRPTPAKYAPTIMDRLHAAGLSWRIYGQPTPPSSVKPARQGYGWDICPSFAECLYTRQKANNVPSASFVRDARSGHLPNFAVITPGGKDAVLSEHNGFSMTAGDDWVGQIASAVMHGPQWRSTTLFITWDDCGCFYDQVRPGVNPDGTAQGPRTPLVIVSPYVKRGFTDRTATTFAGILAYTERTFGLAPLGVNDAHAYPFSKSFDYELPAFTPARTVDVPWPPGAYHVNLKEANQGT